jgi:hypothetical protein
MLTLDVEWFLKELDEISNIFASSILTLKGKSLKNQNSILETAMLLVSTVVSMILSIIG